jgi:hypothetical protein
MGQVTEPRYQRALWKRLCEIGIREYLGVFKFRADASPALLSLSDADAQVVVLQDILDGFEETGTVFFPELWNEVCFQEIGDRNCLVAIIGRLGGRLSNVSYSFQSRAESDPPVVVGQPANSLRWHGIDLQLSRLKPDNGRAVGVNILWQTLKTLVEGRRLKGGAALSRDRLVSRMRFLVERQNFPKDYTNLATIAATLAPHRDEVVRIGRFGRSEKDFFVADMLMDADTCLKTGDVDLDLWWKKYTNADDELDITKSSQALVELYQRAEAMFDEIIHSSFGTVQDEMQGYLVRPVQWHLKVNHKGGGVWPLEKRWFPVKDSSQPKAIVTVISDPQLSDWLDVQKHYENVTRELFRLGRRSNIGVSTWGGQLPQFNGYSWTGGFTGETPALCIVHEWVTEELKTLFSDFPRGL